MKKYFIGINLICIFFVGSVFSIGEGAFTTLHVKAKDVEKYVELMKNNTTPFEVIGSDIAGVCVTKSGNQYPGEMFVWNAFPSIEKAMEASEKYDPFQASDEFKKIRKVQYSVTWKPLKDFKLEPGYERLWRLKLNNWRAYAAKMTEMEAAIRARGFNMNIGLFTPLGGGTEVFHLRAVAPTGGEQGRIIDDYFAGAEWSKIWDESLQYVDEEVSDTIEVCETIYTKS